MNETIIRCSSLSQYPDCNRRAASRLFWREITAAGFRLRTTPYGVGGAIGVAVHKSAEETLREKATSGRLPPESVATDVARDSVNRQISDGVAYDKVAANRGEAQAQATSMAKVYHRLVAPEVEPILIEERLEAEISPGIVLSGTPDLVAREPQRIRDVKTSTRPGGSHAPQIGAYALLAKSNGLDVEEAAIDQIRRVATGKPQPDPVVVEVPLAPAETAARSIIFHMLGDLRAFREGDPERRIRPGDPWAFQANPNSTLCDPKYCPAFGSEFCHEGNPAKERNR